MKYWIMKSEPDVYSIDDLLRDGSSAWYGVRGYQARNYMRDEMELDDKIIFYHSSCAVPGAAGLAEVASLPHADMTQFEKDSPYYDPKSSPEAPIWKCVDVRYVARFPEIIPLSEFRIHPDLRNMRILQKGNRLSITPIAESEYDIIVAMSQVNPV